MIRYVLAILMPLLLGLDACTEFGGAAAALSGYSGLVYPAKGEASETETQAWISALPVR